MSTKKETKPPSSKGDSRPKNVVAGKAGTGKDKKEEDIKQEEPVDQKVQYIETEGFGRFEFIDGTIYEGQWKISGGLKMRHGEGTLKHGGKIGK